MNTLLQKLHQKLTVTTIIATAILGTLSLLALQSARIHFTPDIIADAPEIVDSDTVGGTTQENSNPAIWTLYSDGHLVIEGGPDYTIANFGASTSHWDDHRDLITSIEITGPLRAGTTMAGFFANLHNLTHISGLHYIDTTNTELMSAMFQGTHSLTSLDLSAWDTSNVINMSSMFSRATALTSLDLSAWDTSSVENMFGMFDAFQSPHPSSLTTLNVHGWDTSSVTNMAHMFLGASALTSLDFSTWDTSNIASDAVGNMVSMLSDTTSLAQITFGPYFRFFQIGEFANDVRLPAVPDNDPFSGYWALANNPTHGIFTSADLTAQLSTNSTTASQFANTTWVWSRRDTNLSSNVPGVPDTGFARISATTATISIFAIIITGAALALAFKKKLLSRP